MLKIYRKTYDDFITTVSQLPIESGGIIGAVDNVVCSYFVDNTNYNSDTYKPNADLLNDKIQQWQKSDIEFFGIFHTHPVSVKELSVPDKQSITLLMNQLTDSSKILFFPLVFQDKTMVVFKAEVANGNVVIKKSKIVIINEITY